MPRRKPRKTDGRQDRFAAHRWTVATKIYGLLSQPRRTDEIMAAMRLSRVSVLGYLKALEVHGCVTKTQIPQRGWPASLWTRVEDNPPRRSLFNLPLDAIEENAGIYLAPHYGPVEMAEYIGKAYGLDARRNYEAAIYSQTSPTRVRAERRSDRSAEILQFIANHPGSTVGVVAQRFQLSHKSARGYLRSLRLAGKVTGTIGPGSGKPFQYTITEDANKKTTAAH